jgi:2-keto-4-pentenoate hydratase/2-oxohepta-3-ene-1,7-dioic acid hydratase in catechol pathway
MKLVTFRIGEAEHVGALEGEAIVDLTAAGVAGSMLELIRRGEPALAAARTAIAGGGSRVPAASARLLAPIPRPGKVLCSGINYRGHAEENPSAKMPTYPHFFAKLSNSYCGPDDEIEAPAATKQLDYEVEFAAVIGRTLRRATEDAVMPALFGYTLLDDVSARDVQFADNQITTGKNFDRFAPMGPVILTADAMPRPDAVRLRTRLNGRTMQDGTTADWLFSLPRLISFLSGIMTLEPGDIVSTGTPAGVGIFQKPEPVFMKPGDVIEIEAEGIGVLRNRIVAPR